MGKISIKGSGDQAVKNNQASMSMDTRSPAKNHQTRNIQPVIPPASTEDAGMAFMANELGYPLAPEKSPLLATGRATETRTPA